MPTAKLPKRKAKAAQIGERKQALGKGRKATKSGPNEKPLTLEELVSQITPSNRHKEIDWGPDAGKEIGRR